ncbi:MAG: DMT family transporter [Nitrososphaerales archaeon]
MQANLSTEILGLIFLVLVSLFWGTSFPFTKIVVSSLGTNQYIALRFSLSILLLSPYFIHRLLFKRDEFLMSIKPGVILGLIYFAGIWLQGLGMENTSASNAGFITGLYIPIVYAIELLIYRRKYDHEFMLAIALSFAGMYLLTGSSYESRIGDLIVLAGAFFWALHVLAVDRFSKSYSILDLVLIQYAVTAMVGLTIASPPYILLGWLDFSIVLFYLAAVCSVLVGFLQLEGQSRTTASQAVLIYALEPIFAAVFSFLMLGERLGFEQSIGATMIITSIMISLWGRIKT